MTTESELKAKYVTALANTAKAKIELDDFQAKPKIKVYQNMPVIVEGRLRYASHLDLEGALWFYCGGLNSYINKGNVNCATKDWQPDYDRRSLLTWRPVDETIPEHQTWLVKRPDGLLLIKQNVKDKLLENYMGWKCLPLYEETE